MNDDESKAYYDMQHSVKVILREKGLGLMPMFVGKEEKFEVSGLNNQVRKLQKEE